VGAVQAFAGVTSIGAVMAPPSRRRSISAPPAASTPSWAPRWTARTGSYCHPSRPSRRARRAWWWAEASCRQQSLAQSFRGLPADERADAGELGTEASQTQCPGSVVDPARAALPRYGSATGGSLNARKRRESVRFRHPRFHGADVPGSGVRAV